MKYSSTSVIWQRAMAAYTRVVNLKILECRKCHVKYLFLGVEIVNYALKMVKKRV